VAHASLPRNLIIYKRFGAALRKSPSSNARIERMLPRGQDLAVVKAMREQEQPAVDRRLRMLRLGNSRPPITLLQEAGADLTNPETLRQAVRYFGTLVDELEQGTPA